MAARVSPDEAAPPANIDDLGQRVLSAIVLIPMALGAAIAGGPWLAGAAGAAIVAMSYEWARMSEPKSQNAAWLFALIGALGGVMFASHDRFEWAFAWIAAWAAASALRRRTVSHVIETAGGVFYIGAPCVAFLWLRAQPDIGRDAIIALFAIIWSVDIAAYFAGRLVGGKLLWPSVSPQKTYSGLIGGIIAGAGAAVAFASVLGLAPTPWGIAGAVLAVFGLAGDLFESALKRRFGVKDASKLIPGHGGVLDRLDGMIAATSAAAIALAVLPSLRAVLWSAG
jgi:phosphatidate cytidylyltransferase